LFSQLDLRTFFRSCSRRIRTIRAGIISGGERRRGRRSGIAEIIGTLLLILIAVAAAVVVYAYVIGFIGDSTAVGNFPTSIISIDYACISTTSRCSGSMGFFIVVRNIGTSSIYGVAQVYFTDTTTGSTGAFPCPITGTLNPGGTFLCSGSPISGFLAGNSVSIKVVDPDGGATLIPAKVTS